MNIREMGLDDYESVIKLWNNIEGIGLSNADERDNIASYLQRNPGLSFVAEVEGKVIGAVLFGHDGRRGYIHHLAVAKSHRGKGLGRKLVMNCLNKLADVGIDKCHLFVFKDNNRGQGFWDNIGWEKRNDLVVFSKYT